MEINVNKLSKDYEKYPLKKNEAPTLEDLNYLYLELNLGAKDLQKYFNRGSSTITRWFKHYNIVKPKDMWIKQTKRNWLEKYGVDNPQKDKQVKQKTQQTNLEKYGNVCAMQNSDIQQQIRKKNKQLYGEEFAAKSKIVRAKIEQTNLQKYGCKSSFGNKDVRSKIKNTLLQKYGVDNGNKIDRVTKIIPTTSNNTYLTQKTLYKELCIIFPNSTWIQDKILPSTKFRPDFRNDELKIIVEFDGPRHYTSSSCVIQDNKKNILYSELGYKCIRIPYFVQLSSSVIYNLFGVKMDYIQKFPHGFISKERSLVLPCDYCEKGINRFIDDLQLFNYIKSDIIDSLKRKVNELGNIELVIPNRLQYLFD